MRMTLLIAGLAGAASVAGFAPLHLYPLPILALALLFRLWMGCATPGRAAAAGFAFGLGHFVAGVSWVYVSLHTFGGMPLPLAAFATLAFCAYLALFPALAGYAVTRIRTNEPLRWLVAGPALWTLTEWLRGTLFSGFPWLATGYSQAPDSPLVQFAPVLGVYGVSLAATAVAGAVALVAQRTAIRAAVATAIGVFAAGFGLGVPAWTTPNGAPVTVSLLQGNVAQDAKWLPEQLGATLDTYRRLALSTDSRLIVMPETAVPLFRHEVPEAYLDDLRAHARRAGGDIAIGMPEGVSRDEYYNAVFTIGASPEQRYRKSHLVPFGEIIPARAVFGWVLHVLHIPLSDFSRGSPDQRPLELAGERVAFNICYEDAFGEEIIRQLPEATLLANVSNVAWFGDSIAPHQHLQIARMRAIETGRVMLRATNTGMTAAIDADGRVIAQAAPFTTAVVTATVQGRAGATPYVRWGNAAFLLLAALMLLPALRSARR